LDITHATLLVSLCRAPDGSTMTQQNNAAPVVSTTTAHLFNSATVILMLSPAV
jgi:hypothetical protein